MILPGSFWDVVAVRNAGELYVFGNCRTEILRGLLNFVGLGTTDRFRVVFRAEGASGIVAVFLEFVNFGGETGERGGAPLVFVGV